MKNKKCPDRRICSSYMTDNCEGCHFGDELLKLHKRIDRLKKQNETLTIQRNAWALAAERVAEDRKWISVEDRLPPKHTNVLVYNGSIHQDFICSVGIFYNTSDVTHWMPLPELPKESEVITDD